MAMEAISLYDFVLTKAGKEGGGYKVHGLCRGMFPCLHFC